MTNEIAINIIQNVKDFLQITDDLSSIELLRLLKDHRKRIHPDKFTEETVKKKAEEKFKKIVELIEALDHYIQNEKLNRGAKELALYEPLYDNVALQRDLDEATAKMQSLESSISDLQRENDNMKKALDKKQSDELEKEAQELKLLYKPSPQKLASLGIIFFLSIALATMTKIDEVYNLIRKYSPIQEEYINTAIFTIFIFTLFVVIKQYAENKLLVRKTGEVCSPLFCKSFLAYVNIIYDKEENKPRTFAESDVLAFISGRNAWWKRALSFLGFRMFQIETHDKLKNYFINTLLNKKLVDILHVKLPFLVPCNSGV